jgi:hypothetical protein
MAQVQPVSDLELFGASEQTDALREDALARLYKRRAAVIDLIRCLEEYQSTAARRAEIISISALARS